MPHFVWHAARDLVSEMGLLLPHAAPWPAPAAGKMGHAEAIRQMADGDQLQLLWALRAQVQATPEAARCSDFGSFLVKYLPKYHTARLPPNALSDFPRVPTQRFGIFAQIVALPSWRSDNLLRVLQPELRLKKNQFFYEEFARLASEAPGASPPPPPEAPYDDDSRSDDSEYSADSDGLDLY